MNSLYIVLLLTFLCTAQVTRKDYNAQQQRVVHQWNTLCDNCKKHGCVKITIHNTYYNTDHTNIFSLNTKTSSAIKSLGKDILNDYDESKYGQYADINETMLCATIDKQECGIVLTRLFFMTELSQWVPKGAQEVRIITNSQHHDYSKHSCIIF